MKWQRGDRVGIENQNKEITTMKKVVLGISMMIAAFGMTAVAQTNNTNACTQQSPCSCPSQQCARPLCSGDSAAAPGKGDKARRHCMKDKDVKFGKMHGRHLRVDMADKQQKLTTTLFNGITLTPEQQSRLDELNRKMASERQQARKEMEQKKAEAKAAQKKVREQARADYDKSVKEILTAEQYAKFELNQKEMQARKAAKAEARKAKCEARRLKSEMSKATTTAN